MKFTRYLFIILILTVIACPVAAGAQTASKISCLGQIIAGERSMVLSAPQDSVMGQLLVKRGDRVAKGAELARLRDFDIRSAAVESARKEISLAQAGLALVKNAERPERISAQQAVVAAREAAVGLNSARKARYEKLHANKYVSDETYETIDYNYEAARADLLREKNVLSAMTSGREEEIRQAAARVDVAQANLRLEQARLEAQRIRAPIGGTVLSVLAYPGEAVGEQGILELADTDNIMILAEVYETDAAQVKTGSRAQIRSGVFAGEIGAKVVEIERKVQASRIYPLDPRRHADRRIVLVRLKPDAPERLAPFINAQVTVMINTP
ncbi:MAG: efflux RND transporter periplasmic adaptor subunit [Smithellaceae bacterium]